MRALIAVAFFALAAWFLVGASSTSLPEDLGGSAADPLPRAGLLPVVPRETVPDPPGLRVANLVLECSHCHALFPSDPEPPRVLYQHDHVRLVHGTIESCFDCHSIADHDTLELRDGPVIGFAESTRLCGHCHEPQTKDWQAGVHGRTEGAWDAEDEAHARLECVQCHDPHAPAFDPIEPLPGPDALRTFIDED